MKAGIILALVVVCGVLVFSICFASQMVRCKRFAVSVNPGALGLDYENISFPSAVDGLTIKGWYLPSRGSNRCIIMAHGGERHRADPTIGMLDIAGDLVKESYNVLTFDFRAHGESEGELFTIGDFERRDLLGAVDYVKERGIPPAGIGVLGFSMGAATALVTAAETEDIKAVVADSSYSNLRELIKLKALEYTNVPGFLTPPAFLMAKVLYGFDVDRVTPEESVGEIAPRHIMFIYGEDDTVVMPENSRRLYAAADNPGNGLWLVPGTEHVRAYKTRPEEYVRKVVNFFEAELE